MSKRTQKQVQNAIPSKSIKLENPQLESASPIPILCQGQEISPENKIEDLQTPQVASTSTSNNTKEDRYTFNYWGDTKPNSEQSAQLETNYIKIGDLTLGAFEQQSIVARICYKSEIKETKFGKVVSFLVMDETNEISVVCFGKIGLQLYKEWQLNRIYRFENFKVQEENVNFPSGSNNTFQLRPNSNFIYSSVENQTIVPPISFSFKSVTEIVSLKNNTRIDIIGILLKDYGLETNANNTSLRDLSITDSSKGMIVATLWGEAAQKFKSQENCPIVIRKGVVGEYQERKKINCTFGTLVWSNPLIPEAVPILKWFTECKKTADNGK